MLGLRNRQVLFPETILLPQQVEVRGLLFGYSQLIEEKVFNCPDLLLVIEGKIFEILDEHIP